MTQKEAEHALKLRLAPHPEDPLTGPVVTFAELEGFRKTLGNDAIAISKLWPDSFMVTVQVPVTALVVEKL